MAQPWFGYGATACEAVALGVSLRVPRPMPPALRLTAAYLAISLVENVFERWWAVHYGNNLWFEYVAGPVNTLLILWSFVFWQESDVARLALRITGILNAATGLALLLTIERPDTFGTYSYSIQALLVLGVAVYTFVVRLRATDAPPTRQDWFWVCIGWAVAETFTLLLYPIINTLMAANDLPRAIVAFNIRVSAYGVGMLLIGVGFTRAPANRTRPA